MTLYHATPTANVEAILREGLKPYAQLPDGEALRFKGVGHPSYVWFSNTADMADHIARNRQSSWQTT